MDIHSKIKVLESELEAKRQTLASLESVRSQLEEKAKTYQNMPVPRNRTELLREKERKIGDLEAEIENLEEAKSVQTLIALGRRLDVEEELVFTADDLQKHVDQAKRLQNKYEELKPSLALFLFHLAKLVEKSSGNGHAVRSLEDSKELYLQINDESELAVVQNELINLLIKQGDDYCYSQTDDRDNTLKLALKKYLHARDEIANLRGSEQTNQEINILGRLVRLYEEQGKFSQSLGCRLDRLGCLVRQDARHKIISEIRSINSLCHRLDNRAAAQNWIRTTYFRVKRLFVSPEGVGGLEILKDFAAEFAFRELEAEIETVIQDVQQKQQEYQSRSNLSEWQPKEPGVTAFVSKTPDELYQLIVTGFNKDELLTFCFRLKIDYDVLGGEGKEGKARELILYLERRNLLYQLVEMGKKVRPDISWGELPEEVDQLSASH